MSQRVSQVNSKFHLQLLSDKSLLLVEISGHESEIFLPQLEAGRIALVNVVNNRQQDSKGHSGDTVGRIPFTIQRVGSFHRRQHMRHLTTATAGLSSLPMQHNPKFKLKLISNGNVVLIECPRHESEIFLPHICTGRVAMQRVTANDLLKCSKLRSCRELCTKAMRVAAAAAADNKLQLNPMHFFENSHKSQALSETMNSVPATKRRHRARVRSKQLTIAAAVPEAKHSSKTDSSILESKLSNN